MQAALIVDAWRTNNRVTTFLVENLPNELWAKSLPAAPRRTFRMLVAHLHNARCMWVKTLGREHGIVTPVRVDRRTVSRRELIAALGRSSNAVAKLLVLGCEHDGRIPPSRSYVWRNLSLDVGHVLTYLVAHEAHHRGQIVMAAREVGQRLPASVTAGLWQWKSRS